MYAVKKDKPIEIKKGQCPKCLKHIGRGLAGHLRGCNGDTGRDDNQRGELPVTG